MREPAEVEAADDGGEHAGDVRLLGGHVGGVREQQREQDRQRAVVELAQHADLDQPAARPIATPADRGDDEVQRGVGDAEGARDRRAERDPEGDERGRVVDHRLALHEQADPLGDVHAQKWAVAATGSVGATTAPSTNAAGD